MSTRPQFTAILSFLSEEDGGLSTPVSSGHRAAIKFPLHSERFFGVQKFIGTDLVFPGDKVGATIIITSDNLIDQIYEGLDFEFFEIDKLIGTGIVTKIGFD